MNKRIPEMVAKVQLWEQIEEGLKIADAGYSLHPHEEDRKDFIREYWKSLPDEPPRTFCRPVAGAVYQAYIPLALYDEIRKELYGKRYEGQPPTELVRQ